jgi:BirA family transcriptional regulator, biotin operon repressor / biotin---[acetyl-CoA-carboxylase] ligase
VQTDGRDPLDAATLRSALIGPDLAWRQLDVVTETGSTNADLLSRAAAGEDVDGAVLVAEHQTAGRGRHGRTWSAPPRSQIAMSIGVSVGAVPPIAWGWLPLLTGVAVVDAILQECGIQAGLKWPNDVLVGGSKLAGILAEVCAPAAVVVIGLGVNVTMTADEAPDPAATSLQMLGVPVTDRNGLVRSILRALGSRIERWSSSGGPDDALVADYRRCSLTLGTEVSATMPGDRQVVGIARSIDELGRLRIDTGDAILTVSAGDITHLRPLRGNAPG